MRIKYSHVLLATFAASFGNSSPITLVASIFTSCLVCQIVNIDSKRVSLFARIVWMLVATTICKLSQRIRSQILFNGSVAELWLNAYKQQCCSTRETCVHLYAVKWHLKFSFFSGNECFASPEQP